MFRFREAFFSKINTNQIVLSCVMVIASRQSVECRVCTMSPRESLSVRSLFIIFHHFFARGLVPLTILKHLEEACGEPVHAMFDFVCGTSTGSLLASLLCLEKLSAQEAIKVYLSLSHEVFKMNNLKGVSHLFLNHAFYDSKLLQNYVRCVCVCVCVRMCCNRLCLEVWRNSFKIQCGIE